MIKFLAGNKSKRQLIGLGLSEGNLERLRNGQPINVDLLELGLPWSADVLIFYGKTEQDMYAELLRLGAFSPQTEVHVDPDLE